MGKQTKTVAILGAGVAGLVTAKTLKQYGFEVAVFEARTEIGGVWANNYRSLRVLEPKWVYGYPDWPWPDETPLFPPASEVRKYLTSYCEHFSILNDIRLDSKITAAIPVQDDRWQITFTSSNQEQVEEFDYFVMAPGMFNHKKTPDWPGIKSFTGQLIHSSEFRDYEQINHKKVSIVGFSRSAMDIAVDIAEKAESVTVIYRSIRWPVPEKILGLIRNHVLLFARWPTHFAPPWIRPGSFSKNLHSRFSAVVTGFWKFFEILLKTQFRLKSRNLIPDRPIKLDLFTNLYIAPPGFFKQVGNGKIKSHAGEITAFKDESIQLTGGESLDTDVVIYATGWRHDYSFLPSDLLDKIYDQDGMHLYRHMIHPELSGFAFIGGVQGINSATLYALQATWLAQALTQKFALPGKQEQLAEIEALKTWNKGFVTERPNRSQILNLHQLPYIDDLMKDMGLNPRRKNWLIDQFVPYRSIDYKSVTADTNPS